MLALFLKNLESVEALCELGGHEVMSEGRRPTLELREMQRLNAN
jgi:hypothetical protein